MSAVIAEQSVQQWGNSLAVRLTSKVVKAAHLSSGQSLLVEVVPEGVLLRPGKPRVLTLEQKLALFDPARHGGEFVSDGLMGKEVF